MADLQNVDRNTLKALMQRVGSLCDELGVMNPDQRIGVLMDVEYSGVDIVALVNADRTTFVHDVCGIARHFDRDTKTLGGCFVPRVGMACNVFIPAD